MAFIYYADDEQEIRDVVFIFYIVLLSQVFRL